MRPAVLKIEKRSRLGRAQKLRSQRDPHQRPQRLARDHRQPRPTALGTTKSSPIAASSKPRSRCLICTCWSRPAAAPRQRNAYTGKATPPGRSAFLQVARHQVQTKVEIRSETAPCPRPWRAPQGSTPAERPLRQGEGNNLQETAHAPRFGALHAAPGTVPK